jgi:hypothetical protein
MTATRRRRWHGRRDSSWGRWHEPEQVLADLDIDTRSDVYAPGVIYELLVGRPYDISRSCPVLVTIRSRIHRSSAPSTRVPRDIETIVAKAPRPCAAASN